MSWKITFEAPVGTRVLRGRTCGITHFPRNKEELRDLWWIYDYRKWGPIGEVRKLDTSASTHAPCRSYKAFLRHLRRHTEALKNSEVILVSRFVGHDIKAIWEDDNVS